VVETPTYALELSEAAGGAITRAWEPETGRPLLTGPSNDLVSYQESGGLWRMGYEFRGGIWREKERAGAQRVDLDVREGEHGLEISRRVTLDGQLIRQTMWLRDDSPLIRCRVEGLPAERRTIVVRLRSTVSTDRLTMDTPGGVVARPPRRIYDPTFWPLRHFVHLHDEEGRGIALLQAHPGAVSYRPDGTIELVALRNAVRERVLGLVPLPANPAAGHEWEPYTFTYAMLFTTEGDWRANGIDRIAHEFLNSAWNRTGRAILRDRAAAAVVVDRPDVFVTAVKPASRGQGLIVRLSANAVPAGPVAVAVPAYEVEAAFLCDARERDLSALQIRDGQVRLSMPGTIATLRLVPT
jgi:alpha-mannosidase